MSVPRKIKLVKKPVASADKILNGVGGSGEISMRALRARMKISTDTHSKNRGGEHGRIDVWVEEINGIAYYLDKNGNVYDTECVLENRPNPAIIGHYTGTAPNITIDFS